MKKIKLQQNSQAYNRTNLKNQIVTTQKLKLWLSEIVIKLKIWNCDNSKHNTTMIWNCKKNWNCDKTEKLKLWQHSITWIATQLKSQIALTQKLELTTKKLKFRQKSLLTLRDWGLSSEEILNKMFAIYTIYSPHLYYLSPWYVFNWKPIYFFNLCSRKVWIKQ